MNPDIVKEAELGESMNLSVIGLVAVQNMSLVVLVTGQGTKAPVWL